MLFEEFFKKKKINLTALQQGEPALFSEFENHYQQMGEKSFDHTKKYWFNKLRRQYPLPPEVKAERLRPENQMAEQTVSDTLTEPSPQEEAPKLGFKPKFEAASPPQQATVPENITPAAEDTQPVTAPDTPAAVPPKPGFKPRFKAGVTTAKPANEAVHKTEPEITPEQPDTSASNTGVTEPEPQPAPAKKGFKPRFKAGLTTAKPAAEPPGLPEPEAEKAADPSEATGAPAPAEESAVPKPAYKPRFSAKMIKPKPPEE